MKTKTESADKLKLANNKEKDELTKMLKDLDNKRSLCKNQDEYEYACNKQQNFFKKIKLSN